MIKEVIECNDKYRFGQFTTNYKIKFHLNSQKYFKLNQIQFNTFEVEPKNYYDFMKFINKNVNNFQIISIYLILLNCNFI